MSYVTLQSALALLNDLYRKEQQEKRVGSAPKAQVYEHARKKLYDATKYAGYEIRTSLLRKCIDKWKRNGQKHAFAESTKLKKAAWQEVLAMAEEQLVFSESGTENDLKVEWRGEKGVAYQAWHTKERVWVSYVG
jgi:hypothetical protein